MDSQLLPTVDHAGVSFSRLELSLPTTSYSPLSYIRGLGIIDDSHLQLLPFVHAIACCKAVFRSSVHLDQAKSPRWKICIGIYWKQAKSRRPGPNEERKIVMQQVNAHMNGKPCKCKQSNLEMP